MRKVTVLLSSLLFFVSCHKNDATSITNTTSETAPFISQRTCASNDVLQAQLAADPSLRQRMNAIEAFTQNAIASNATARLANDGSVIIPVVVNVLYRTAAENISAAQIQSQIDVLNEDYNNTNKDNSSVPSIFKTADASVGVHFELANIVRKSTNKKSWSANDAMKKSSQGGINPTDPAHNLNIWSCNLGQSLLGYAQFPGGNPATDGVVILYSALGRTGTLIPKYDKGRTATHEIGHWMNLRHIWGDANCGDDLVADTPQADAANYGCPAFPKASTCTQKLTEMTMDYMDYTDDACMYMFSNGQKQRMLAVFVQGGPRYSFAQ